MSCRVIAFLNAVLVEEVTENFRYWQQQKSTKKKIWNNINMDNTIEPSLVWRQNVEFLNSYKASDMIPFTYWITRCPLLIGYIDWRPEKWNFSQFNNIDIQLLKRFFSIETNPYTQLSFTEILNNIGI